MIKFSYFDAYSSNETEAVQVTLLETQMRSEHKAPAA